MSPLPVLLQLLVHDLGKQLVGGLHTLHTCVASEVSGQFMTRLSRSKPACGDGKSWKQSQDKAQVLMHDHPTCFEIILTDCVKGNEGADTHSSVPPEMTPDIVCQASSGDCLCRSCCALMHCAGLACNCNDAKSSLQEACAAIQPRSEINRNVSWKFQSIT